MRRLRCGLDMEKGRSDEKCKLLTGPTMNSRGEPKVGSLETPISNVSVWEAPSACDHTHSSAASLIRIFFLLHVTSNRAIGSRFSCSSVRLVVFAHNLSVHRNDDSKPIGSITFGVLWSMHRQWPRETCMRPIYMVTRSVPAPSSHRD